MHDYLTTCNNKLIDSSTNLIETPTYINGCIIANNKEIYTIKDCEAHFLYKIDGRVNTHFYKGNILIIGYRNGVIHNLSNNKKINIFTVPLSIEVINNTVSVRDNFNRIREFTLNLRSTNIYFLSNNLNRVYKIKKIGQFEYHFDKKGCSKISSSGKCVEFIPNICDITLLDNELVSKEKVEDKFEDQLFAHLSK